MKTVIETQNIHKTFGEGVLAVHALNDVSIKINRGEFTALVGPSGSGKTTLLNVIGGLDTPSTGQAILNETEITSLSSSEKTDFRLNNIGFVFQAYNLIPVLSAYENAEFIMLLQNKPMEERKKRVMHLLNEVGLKGKEKNKPGELSGGQQQRVAVVRALASKPAFILADEPTANLDSKSTADLLDLMYQLNQEEEVTFVFSTHDQRVIDRAKRVIHLEDGCIVNDEVR